MIILETNRLVFRHQVLSDVDDLWALYCDPEITRFIPDVPKTYQEARDELEWHMHGYPLSPGLGLWATIHKQSGKFIGRCGLLPWIIDGLQEVEVAYTISREFWGQGLATEAALAIVHYGFQQLNLRRLVCLIDSENIRSGRVADKIGMRFYKESRDEVGPFLVYKLDNSRLPYGYAG